MKYICELTILINIITSSLISSKSLWLSNIWWYPFMLAMSHEHSEPLAVTETAFSSGPKGITPVDNVAWNRVSPIPVHWNKHRTYDQWNLWFSPKMMVFGKLKEQRRVKTRNHKKTPYYYEWKAKPNWASKHWMHKGITVIIISYIC